MNKTQIRSYVKRLIEKSNKMFKTNIDRPTVTFFNKGQNAGWSESVSNVVAFNEILALENPVEFRDVVVHEVAHIVTDKLFPNATRMHGQEFKVVCRALGGSGETRHDLDVSSVRIKYKRKK